MVESPAREKQCQKWLVSWKAFEEESRDIKAMKRPGRMHGIMPWAVVSGYNLRL